MPFTVEQILEWSKGRWVNSSVTQGLGVSTKVNGVSELGLSRPTDLAYFFSKEFQSALTTAKPGVLVTGDAFVGPIEKSGLPLWKSTVIIACADPYRTMAVLSEHFAKGTEPKGEGVHASAVVAPDAKLGAAVWIGPHAVIESGAEIGRGTHISAGCVIGRGVKIGSDGILFPNVTVYDGTQIGSRVRVHAGAVIGADGFGYAPVVEAGKVTGHQKIYHTGRVIIGDDVEIGANSCVDRGTFGDTVISSNVKLDNLVQVGHNARLDEGAVMCGSSALAGSASLGKYSYIGGLTGVSNKVHVGDYAKVGALALVTKDVPPATVAAGNPQREYHEHFRAHAELNRLVSAKKSAKTKKRS